MTSVIISSLESVGPILLLILAGYLLRRTGFVNEEFLRVGNRLVFYVCLPLYLFYNIYEIESIHEISLSILVYAVIATIVLFGIGFVIAVCLVPEADRKGVVLQCVFRSNFAIIGIPLADSLYGAEGVKTAALISALTIPLYNVLAVIALTIFIREDQVRSAKEQWKNVGKKIVKNPLIRGVFLGILALLLREILPEKDGAPIISLSGDLGMIYRAITMLSAIASPLALIVLGGNFTLQSLAGRGKELAIGTFMRTIAAPVLAIGAAYLLSAHTELLPMTPAAYASYTALFGTPVAVSSAIMAREMHNDGDLAGQLVVTSSLSSVVTLFLIVVVLQYYGLM